MANIGESRSELLHWLNNLLDLNYTKVEQCGTGAAYCQIIDLIYGDVPMGKVKFTVQYEYEFLLNYKVLQLSFAKHGIQKSVPVERLSKCKMQDNLEFLQWIKRFWGENKDETPYDATARRKGRPTAPGARAQKPLARSASLRAPSSMPTSSARPAPLRVSMGASTTTRTGTVKRVVSRNTSRPTPASAERLQELERELAAAKAAAAEQSEELQEYKSAAEGLETERNFYFNKLRDIEILSQAITDQLSEEAEKEHQQQLNGNAPSDVLEKNQNLIEFVEKIQDILYLTEEGFSVPNLDVELEGEVSDVEDGF